MDPYTQFLLNIANDRPTNVLDCPTVRIPGDSALIWDPLTANRNVFPTENLGVRRLTDHTVPGPTQLDWAIHGAFPQTDRVAGTKYIYTGDELGHDHTTQGELSPRIKSDLFKRFPYAPPPAAAPGRRVRRYVPPGFTGPCFRDVATNECLGQTDSERLMTNSASTPALGAAVSQVNAGMVRLYAFLTFEKRRAFWEHGASVKNTLAFQQIQAFKQTAMGTHLEQLCMPHKNDIVVVAHAELVVEALRSVCNAVCGNIDGLKNLNLKKYVSGPGLVGEAWLPAVCTLGAIFIEGQNEQLPIAYTPDMIFDYAGDTGNELWVCTLRRSEAEDAWNNAVETAIAVFMHYGGFKTVRAVLLKTRVESDDVYMVTDTTARSFTTRTAIITKQTVAHFYDTVTKYANVLTHIAAARRGRRQQAGNAQTLVRRGNTRLIVPRCPWMSAFT